MAKTRYRFTIECATIDVVCRENVQPAIGHYMAHILCGGSVPEETLAAWGVTVKKERIRE